MCEWGNSKKGCRSMVRCRVRNLQRKGLPHDGAPPLAQRRKRRAPAADGAVNNSLGQCNNIRQTSPGQRRVAAPLLQRRLCPGQESCPRGQHRGMCHDRRSLRGAEASVRQQNKGERNAPHERRRAPPWYAVCCSYGRRLFGQCRGCLARGRQRHGRLPGAHPQPPRRPHGRAARRRWQGPAAHAIRCA